MAEKTDIKVDGYVVVQAGVKCGVGYAVRSNGDQEARDFYLTLKKTNPKALAGLRHVFEELMKFGVVQDETKFNKVIDKIWEAKHHRSGARVFCFHWNGAWLATHGWMKKKQKTRPEDKQRALEIMKEHIDRFGNSV